MEIKLIKHPYFILYKMDFNIAIYILNNNGCIIKYYIINIINKVISIHIFLVISELILIKSNC